MLGDLFILLRVEKGRAGGRRENQVGRRWDTAGKGVLGKTGTGVQVTTDRQDSASINHYRRQTEPYDLKNGTGIDKTTWKHRTYIRYQETRLDKITRKTKTK